MITAIVYDFLSYFYIRYKDDLFVDFTSFSLKGLSDIGMYYLHLQIYTVQWIGYFGREKDS